MSKTITVLTYAQIVGINLFGMKGKMEISQRFYVMQSQAGISIDDAYRHLQNQWLEEMLAKRKQVDKNNNESNEANGFGTGLLKKKHQRRTNVSK